MIEKKMTNGTPFIIDDVDADLVEVNWYCNEDGYAWRHFGPKHNRGKVYLHRLILERKISRELQAGEFVDHHNRNKQDNRRDNLRVTDRSGNMRNISVQKNNKSGYKGVYYAPYRTSYKKWRAQIGINHKTKVLGHFATPEEAAHAYDSAALIYFGEYACLNFPKFP